MMEKLAGPPLCVKDTSKVQYKTDKWQNGELFLFL